MAKSATIHLTIMMILFCCTIQFHAFSETTQEENIMTDYDFTVFTNVKITGIDLNFLTKEELSVLYQVAC